MKKMQTILRSKLPSSLTGRMGWVCPMGISRLCLLFFILHSSFFILHSNAQEAAIIIGGNVYGGGNQGNVDGNTTVTIKGGDLQKVFGGARMANVGGRTFLNIYGEEATSDIFITEGYGGNDIAGTIGLSGEETTVPLITYYTEEEATAYNTANGLTSGDPGYKEAGDVKDPGLTEVLTGAETKETNPEKNAIDNTWKTFVRTSRSSKDDGSEKNAVIIGKLFGGGNGDYFYREFANDDHRIYLSEKDYLKNPSNPIAQSTTGFPVPELPKTYLEIKGGFIAHLFGGGNNATITENTTISINNESDDIENQATVYAAIMKAAYEKENPEEDKIPIESYTDEVLTYLMGKVNINTFQSNYTRWDFNSARVFGGNNKAAMAIQPAWNLQAGKIRDLYSGGNQGNMTCPNGLLLNINPKVGNPYPLVVENVFGGCRMADVRPQKPNGTDVDEVDNLPGYFFPRNMAARTLVQGGDINNVYGGNDIKGKVYFGNAVGVTTSIRGDIYGGGNGAYAYTDNPNAENDFEYGDFWYSSDGYSSSVEALNDIRPDAEQVSIMVRGKEGNPTVIGGSIFCGGNCATLETESSHATLKDYPLVELKIGSHVRADNVYLGNNGEGMIQKDVLKLYQDKNVTIDGNDGQIFSNIELTNDATMKTYMEGVAMNIIPKIVYEDKTKQDRETYEPYTSYIGSLFCGGNVGSMTYEGKNSMMFDAPIIVYNKVVGGCNNASVKESKYNAFYDGGILGSHAEQEDNGYMDGDNIQDRLEMNFNGLRIEPKRLNSTFTQVTSGTTLTKGKRYYTTDLATSAFIADGTEVADATNTYWELTTLGKELEWNTAKWDDDEDDFMEFTPSGTLDKEARLLGGNIYGGCYESGHVNGNVVINVNQDVIKKDDIFKTGANESNVDFLSMREDVTDIAMSVFGGGYGKQTEIWGSTTVNLNKGYIFQAFGGGELGVVGKGTTQTRIVKDEYDNDVEEIYRDYAYDPRYSCTVNLQGSKPIYSSDDADPDIAESEYLYGGGNEGDVCGDTYVNLGKGRIYDAFGGASNADILGHAEVRIGNETDFPWISDNVYGGNDFGGTIRGTKNHSGETTRTVLDPAMMESNTFVKYIQGRVDSIFGGSYGSYDYTDPEFHDYTYTRGESLPGETELGDPKEGFNFPHLAKSSFVLFQPVNNTNNHVGIIFGGSEGYPGSYKMNNSMQGESYVLIDDVNTVDDTQFANVDVYGGGAFAGLGSFRALGAGRTMVDLFAGSVKNVYGGSNKESLIGYTRVNVPAESTIKANALYGGGKGYAPEDIDANPALAARYCDNYVTCIDYQSADARVENGIYGGNRNCRIAYDTYINVGAPVKQSNGYDGTIYGAGYGTESISGRTNIYMNSDSKAYKVFGGGRDGNVFNFASMTHWMGLQYAKDYDHSGDEGTVAAAAAAAAAAAPGKVKGYGNFLMGFKTYVGEAGRISLPSPMPTYQDNIWEVQTIAGVPTLVDAKTHYNTNVHLMQGSTVSGYAYGGGFGSDAIVSGTTYLELKGGTVDRDIYGGGQGGHVFDEFGFATDADDSNDFVATTNVYIEGGTARNVYGGGYLGHVGRHTKTVAGAMVDADISDTYENDILGVTNLVIGKAGVNDFLDGCPAIQRNVYGAGEGGSVWGTTNVTLNNGYVGYRYKNTGTAETPVYKYVEELDDQKPNSIVLAGNVFGGGYVVNSYVDYTNVNMYGGTVRGSLYGGGEVGPVGRGTMKSGASGGVKNGPNNEATIYRAGKTHVRMFDGLVLRNVYGGGRGKDSWGGDGTMYMDEAIKPTLDLKCKGYVFGQTEVDIHGGEVGTEEGMAYGYGNVFGGCDEGSVYSAYEKDGDLFIGKKSGKRYNAGIDPSNTAEYNYQGYYYKHENGDFATTKVAAGTYTAAEATAYNTEHSSDPGFVAVSAGDTKYRDERQFTEDCKVLVEPWLQVTANDGILYNTHTYEKGAYIPTAYLNTLKAKTGDTWPAEWNDVDVGTVEKERGIHIHNAVFAGGNIASGSSDVYANTPTVFGNATATIHDVYNRDLITIGTGHTGGLYGDGNLTFVDGYRELNITNYGTDKYHLASPLTIEEYKLLPKREQAYYEPKYECAVPCTDNENTTYSVGSTLPYDELTVLFLDKYGKSLMDGSTPILNWDAINNKWIPNPTYWKEKGVISTYAGRIMNTIQRADFCGVFGSRMVMKGAQDRVPEKVDFTNYTINRVREVSLNKMVKADEPYAEDKLHGNYFGIYSNVNFLGALTSDVDFHSVRTTNRTEDDLKADGSTTFEQWKEAHKTDRKRNNGACYNQLAMASGVYLEITTEESTGNTLDKKVWGPITGVVELDLINVQPGIGGGFVYAKNEHGVRSTSNIKSTTLTALNDKAVTKWDFNYDETEEPWDGSSTTGKKEWETSGNFIHSSQTIIDDCYNVSNRYLGASKVPAHYWYISGTVYVYDQYISAHTGSPNAYRETVEIPITINAASNGTMTLMDVQPNLYAYYSSYTDASTNTPLTEGKKLVINDVTYQLNTPISYWDWYKLPAAEKNLFVKDTYVTTTECTTSVGTTKFPAGTYPAGTVLLAEDYTALRNLHKPVSEDEVKVYQTAKEEYVDFDNIFRSSNNMSHNTGYLLTYNVTNPQIWDQWYTQVNSTTHAKNQTGGDGYQDGPTYYPTTDGLYGQKEYAVADVIPETVYNTYQTAVTTHSLSLENQATFVPAHIVTSEYLGSGTHYYPGATVDHEISGYTAPAYVCTSTIQLSATEYIYINQVMREAEKTALLARFGVGGAEENAQIAKDINDLIKPAYYCKTAGLYGGSYYTKDYNYRALEAWSAMSETDRQKFNFNYDALDLLIDPTYGGNTGRKYQYDSKAANQDGAQANGAHYSLKQPIDYMATYNGTTDETAHNGIKRTNGVEYNRSEYESLPNEQRHYAAITVKQSATTTTCYVVNTDFVHIETPYAVGATLSSDEYEKLAGSEKNNVTTLTFPSAESDKTYYYCREPYTIGEKTEGVAVTSATGVTGATGGNYAVNAEVPVGVVIDETNYSNLKNYQKDFTIHGESPMETSTLYVSRTSDINDLSTEKVITVIYKYDYEESDASGMHITPVSERHIVNIHINFKSGVPIVEDIPEPNKVLPGTSITMRVPTVTPGAYEILGGGWEIFEDESDAESHINGVPYAPSIDSLYWYQDGFYLAYYAKTYLGKTYSNHVPIGVANYHDLKKVMDDKKYHLHVDYDRTRLKRDSKVYINNYSGTEDGLDYLRDFYDLSLISASGDGYTVSGNKITAATGSANTNLVDHALLNISTDTGKNKYYPEETDIRGVKAGTNLEFFLRTDINHTGSWKPIGSIDNPETPAVDESQCFEGNLHGDGHTISGLDHSLFENLCGNVYNLGVTGSFTSAGVADVGTGYVESTWVKTTGTPAADVRAVFGNPTATANIKQVVNSYCQTGKTYNTTDTDNHGLATAMEDKAFYNGTLAYDLNNFYLYKRYNDKNDTEGTFDQGYQYYTIDSANKLELQPVKYYGSHPELCSSGYLPSTPPTGFEVPMYVEDRFADGDFRYAAGEIPLLEDERCYVDKEHDNTEYFFPIWPDDYLFFGQALNYDYVEGFTHQNVPTAINRFEGRIDNTENSNRVYRAPAYYRNNTMDVAHFNRNAVFAQSKKGDATTLAYKNMTAIDFTGYNDTHVKADGDDKPYELGWQGGKFFAPLLDEDGLTSFKNIDLTRNLLVYTTSAGTTTATVSTYLTEHAYEEVNMDYRNVERKDPNYIHGHWIQQTGGTFATTRDQLLVDLNDFNAPIAYDFTSDKRMFYQRTPEDEEFVDRNKGWQGISIPFTAELVTTDQKGEITHFYDGSETSKNETGSKIGHEYWLRQYRDITGESDPGAIQTARFTYPTKNDGTVMQKTKQYDGEVTNTFLWDYYYKAALGHNHLDYNKDTYQTYYKESREYNDYPLLTASTPYIIGLPGKTYFEFDLSGTFNATTTASPNPTKLDKQTISFVSQKNISIGVSDEEMVGVTYNGYTFKPSYLNSTTMESGYHAFLLNSDGNSYVETASTTPDVVAFRPYFTAAVVSPTKEFKARYINFSNDGIGDLGSDDDSDDNEKGDLEIYSKGRKIYTVSHLEENVDIRIVNASGAVITTYTLKPGKTIVTNITNPGAYIVNKRKLYIK